MNSFFIVAITIFIFSSAPCLAKQGLSSLTFEEIAEAFAGFNSKSYVGREAAHNFLMLDYDYETLKQIFEFAVEQSLNANGTASPEMRARSCDIIHEYVYDITTDRYNIADALLQSSQRELPCLKGLLASVEYRSDLEKRAISYLKSRGAKFQLSSTSPYIKIIVIIDKDWQGSAEALRLLRFIDFGTLVIDDLIDEFSKTHIRDWHYRNKLTLRFSEKSGLTVNKALKLASFFPEEIQFYLYFYYMDLPKSSVQLANLIGPFCGNPKKHAAKLSDGRKTSAFKPVAVSIIGWDYHTPQSAFFDDIEAILTRRYNTDLSVTSRPRVNFGLSTIRQNSPYNRHRIDQRGQVVSYISRDGVFFDKPINKGDIITKLNGLSCVNEDQYRKIVQQLSHKNKIEVEYIEQASQQVKVLVVEPIVQKKMR